MQNAPAQLRIEGRGLIVDHRIEFRKREDVAQACFRIGRRKGNDGTVGLQDRRQAADVVDRSVQVERDEGAVMDSRGA
jgi:hypothetical protein